jgi:DNA primase
VGIPEEEVAQVRSATDLVGLVGEHVALRRQGRNWVGLCPFHEEKTPSFSVNAEAGFYYCFGCQAKGDAITFVRDTEHLDFVDALRWLADRNGITLHEDRAEGRGHQRRAALFDAVEAAVAWYHERLLSAKDAGRARDYLRSRGYDGDTVRRFRLGWAPEDWDAMSRSVPVKKEVLTASGLSFVNRRGRLQDFHRARVLFPICDPSGRPVAIGGRVLPPGPPAEPKYKNTPETAIYAKRRTLYALHWAKEDIVATGEVVVCEGYTDVIGCFSAGVPRAVATCGTALAEDHFKLLRNFGRRIVLAYDADTAGQAAMTRVYEWERRHEVDVAVATLPAGSDPGELARRDPGALARAVADAEPFLEFRVERALRGDLSTPEARARVAEAAVAVIAEHPAALVRDQYLMKVADRCRLDAAALRPVLEEALGAHRSQKTTSATGPPAAGPSPRRRTLQGAGRSARVTDEGAELEALRFLVRDQQLIAPRLNEVLFGEGPARRAFLALSSAGGVPSAVETADREDPEVGELLHRLVVEEPTVPEEAIGDPVEGVVLQLVRRATWAALGEVRGRARSAPDALGQVAKETAYLQFWLQRLDDPATADEAAGRLVAWLADRATPPEVASASE